MQLRPDQVLFCKQVSAALCRAPHSVLAVAPTGSGKTVCFSSLTKEWTTKNLFTRVMILVHRRELLQQVSACLTSWGVEHGIIAPDAPNHKSRRVQIASVLTLVRRLAEHDPPDYLIIDEAHHAILGSSWGEIFRAWPRAKRLGVTATPERLSGEGLREVFSTLVCGPSVKELMDLGALSSYRLFAPPVQYADRVTRHMGDYARGELAKAMDTRTITGDAVQHYFRLAKGKRTMVFCVSVAHAESVAQKFVEAGVSAQSIDGEMTNTERAGILALFAAGTIDVLTSCDLVSEGFDLPAVEVAILLRPTQSLALHLQQMGRALRPYPGKVAAIILDHAGNTARHGFPDDVRAWSLDGKAARRKLEGDCDPSVKVCPKCFAAVVAMETICPECGHEFQIVNPLRSVVYVEGTLTEVDLQAQRQAARAQQGATSSLEGLISLGKSRGYRNPYVWAKHVWESRQSKRQGVGGSY